MKKILVIYTGGTICTTVRNGQMDTDSAAATALLRLYTACDSPYKDSVVFENGKQFGILSENMTVAKWNEMITYFQAIMPELHQYSGVIVAHGTDTLAYSTALFSVLLQGVSIPVIFVSSHSPILNEDGSPNESANGVPNFSAAVECICKGIQPDVYVTYQNPEDGRMYLHKGAHLVQCAIYDDNFYSRDMVDITCGMPHRPFPVAPTSQPMPLLTMQAEKLTDCILKVDPYVGLNYDWLDLTGVKGVLHGTYHSGTACVDSPDDSRSILHFFDRCAARRIPFYFSPAKRGKEQTVYASVPLIENHRAANGRAVRFCYGQTQELLYAKLLWGYSMGFSEAEIEKLLQMDETK